MTMTMVVIVVMVIVAVFLFSRGRGGGKGMCLLQGGSGIDVVVLMILGRVASGSVYVDDCSSSGSSSSSSSSSSIRRRRRGRIVVGAPGGFLMVYIIFFYLCFPCRPTGLRTPMPWLHVKMRRIRNCEGLWGLRVIIQRVSGWW